MSDTVTVHIVGVGIDKTVEVSDGSPLGDALSAADQSTAASGLQVRVNGELVNDDYTPRDGDTVVVVPPAVKLG